MNGTLKFVVLSDLHAESVLRRRMLEGSAAPVPAFPGNGEEHAELAEMAALKKEVAKLKAERRPRARTPRTR